MNADVMFSSKTDLWETPQEFFDRLNDEFGFDLDVCALPENAKCASYYTQDQDGLSQPWDGVCWCNPPYGRNIGLWVKKALDENNKYYDERRGRKALSYRAFSNLGYTPNRKFNTANRNFLHTKPQF